MGIFSKAKNAEVATAKAVPEPKAEAAIQHAVIVQFNFPAGDVKRIIEVEDELAKALEETGSGELDGNEIAMDGRDNLFYLYGPDADKLYAAIEPVLLSSEILSQAKVLLRYGSPSLDTKQKTITLPAWSGTRH
jgi:hypothetical protein